jgi:hypothetical protein
MRELHRVLKPGGQLIVANEPVRALRSPQLNPGSEVAEFEGHEHAYLRRSYISAARAAGLKVNVYAPSRLWPFNDATLEISARMSTLAGLKIALGHSFRRNSVLGSAYLAWKTYVEGISLHMVATKTGAPTDPKLGGRAPASSAQGSCGSASSSMPADALRS